MPLRFAYTRPDGGVSIVVAAPRERLEKMLGKFASGENYIAHIRSRSIPQDASNVTQLPDDWAAPDDRTFRDAWEFEDGEVVCNMDKAREIHREYMRQARKPLLDALDVEFHRAYKDPTKQDEIEAKKQALRDVTDEPDIEIASTPEELKAVWPEVLEAEKSR